MVLSMNKEFGVPLSEAETSRMRTMESERGMINIENLMQNVMFDDTTTNVQDENKQIIHTSRVWTPIDNLNVSFMSRKKERSENPRDFIRENTKEITKLSLENK